MPTCDLKDLQVAALQQPGAVRRHAGIKFQCPACAVEGHDAHQDNACLFNDGRWGCAWATDSELARTHRQAIGRALDAFDCNRPATTLSPPPPRAVELQTAVATPLRLPGSAMIGLGRDFADLYSGYLESPRSVLYFAFLTSFG